MNKQIEEMADYIDRAELIQWLDKVDGCIADGTVEAPTLFKQIMTDVKQFPKADVVPRSEVERLTKELLDKDIEMENEVHRLETYIEQIEKEADDWESVSVNRELEIKRLQNILLQFTDIVHQWGAKHNFDTTEISLVPILEQEANSIIDQAKQDVAREIVQTLNDYVKSGDCLVYDLSDEEQNELCKIHNMGVNEVKQSIGIIAMEFENKYIGE